MNQCAVFPKIQIVELEGKLPIFFPVGSQCAIEVVKSLHGGIMMRFGDVFLGPDLLLPGVAPAPATVAFQGLVKAITSDRR